MKALRHPLVALGLAVPAACSAPAPTAHRAARTTETAAPAPHPGAPDSRPGADDEATTTSPPGSATTTEAPTTTVTVTVPSVPRTSTTFTVPERADDDMSDAEWAIRSTFPETPDKAVRVARCESGLNPGAVSPDGANWGLMQVNVVHKGLAARMGYSWDQMLQVAPNLAVSRAIYDDAGGWSPWSCT